MTSGQTGVRCFMGLKFYSASRRTPDALMEELVSVLLRQKSMDFKALFLEIHAVLKERNISGGGEEMLRLRTYDKLQNLVRDGVATKVGGKYRGVKKRLLLLSSELRERRIPVERRPGTSPAKRTRSGVSVISDESAQEKKTP